MRKNTTRVVFSGLFCITIVVSSEAADLKNGETIFLKSCWGCHHQNAEAFGPSFQFIANNRTDSQIKAQIIRPEIVSKELGYKRNSMPAFKMDGRELDDITEYIRKQK